MEQTKVPQSALRFLATAQQDLKAARCLHENGYYPQAVFYLEQSVEKGLKSYSITLGIIDESEARREISHKTLKIYEKSTKNFRQRVVTLQENLKKIPQLENFFNQQVNFAEILGQRDHALDQIHTLLKQDIGSLRLTQEELNKHITSLQDLHREAQREKSKIQSRPITPSEFRKYKRSIVNMLRAAIPNDPEKIKQANEELNRDFTFETYEKIMKDAITRYVPPIEVFQSLLPLSIILQSHAVARYPAPDFVPLEFYTPDLPLIKSFSKLADITERVLNQVDEIYQNAEGRSVS
ncbi:HEPN domain-containing protein [Methanoregula sp.]|uniref:HEPN domain-containing protein n=1 Tax=Methanoregula sp. TaxID=2052170 RepID=UPI0035697D8C